MAHSLNLTLKIKQDPETLASLKEFHDNFPNVQDQIAKVMKESKILHFARIVVFGEDAEPISAEHTPRYLQVLTTYDGDRKAYTEFFRKELTDVFKLVFSFAEGVDDADALVNDPDKFFNFSKGLDIHPIGNTLSDDSEDGFVFSAYGNLTVTQILSRLGDDAP